MKHIKICMAALAAAGFSSLGWGDVIGSESDSANRLPVIAKFNVEKVPVYTKSGTKTEKTRSAAKALLPQRVLGVSPLGLLLVVFDGEDVWIARENVVLEKGYKPCPRTAQSRAAHSRTVGSQAYTNC